MRQEPFWLLKFLAERQVWDQPIHFLLLTLDKEKLQSQFCLLDLEAPWHADLRLTDVQEYLLVQLGPGALLL